MPLSAEHMAAAKHSNAPITKACVKAAMNGEAIAFGKKLCPVSRVYVFLGKVDATVPMPFSIVSMGL